MDTQVFHVGGMDGNSTWQLRTEVNCTTFDTPKPCKHCHSMEADFGGEKPLLSWICPRVVFSFRGHFSSTGVCLDCILEAVKESE